MKPNEWPEAARKAAEDIEKYEDEHESYLSLNGSKEITAEIIAKSHADLRATYENNEETVKRLSRLLLNVIEVCEDCRNKLVPEDKLKKMHWRFNFNEIYRDGMHRLPVKLAQLLRECVDSDPLIQAAIERSREV